MKGKAKEWNHSAWIKSTVLSEHNIVATKHFEKKVMDSKPRIQPVYKSLYTCDEE